MKINILNNIKSLIFLRYYPYLFYNQDEFVYNSNIQVNIPNNRDTSTKDE